MLKKSELGQVDAGSTDFLLDFSTNPTDFFFLQHRLPQIHQANLTDFFFLIFEPNVTLPSLYFVLWKNVPR